MKYLLAFTLSVVLSLPCLAQSYLVYTVKGEVVSKDKAKAAPIRPGDQLTEKAVVSVSADGRLTVIDEKGETLFTLKEGIGTLSSLIENQQSKARPVTPSFLAFVKEKISTKNNPKDVNYMQAAGVTYRGWGQHWIPLQAGTPGTLLDPLRESFALARQAIARFGSAPYKNYTTGKYPHEMARDSLPPEVWHVMELMGYQSMCMSENIDVLRAQFIRAWERQEQVRQEREQLLPFLPEAVKEKVLGIGE